MATKTLDDVDNILSSIVSRMTARTIEATFMRVRNEILSSHQTMFKYLATKANVIGATPGSNPTLAGFKPLADATVDRKARLFGRLGVPYDPASFYYHSGGLMRYFEGKASPRAIFGEPKMSWVRFADGGYYEYTTNSRGQFRKRLFSDTNKALKGTKLGKMSKELGAIAVDLYPKVEGKIARGMSMHKYFKSESSDSGKTGTKTLVAYKLENFRGGRDREFMPQFMRWWLNNYMRKRLRKAVT